MHINQKKLKAMKERVFEVVQNSYWANATHPDGTKHYIVFERAINGSYMDAIRRNEDRPLLSIRNVGHIDAAVIDALKDIDGIIVSLENRYYDIEQNAINLDAKVNIFNMRYDHRTWLWKEFLRPIESARMRRAEILREVPGYDGGQTIIY